MDFETLLYRMRQQKGDARVVSSALTIVGIDPGETTGVSTWNGVHLESCDQLKTKEMPLAACVVGDYLRFKKPALIVMEEYRIYNWKTRSHANSSVHTLRLIGAIQYIAYTMRVRLEFQGAGEGKGFCTDDKLKDWGMYQTAMRHANDAIRHVAHNLLFRKD